jgi:hypothetical protein
MLDDNHDYFVYKTFTHRENLNVLVVSTDGRVTLYTNDEMNMFGKRGSRFRATMQLSPHPNDIRVRLVDMSVPWQTPRPTVKDVFLTELVIIDVRNWFFFHPLL